MIYKSENEALVRIYSTEYLEKFRGRLMNIRIFGRLESLEDIFKEYNVYIFIQNKKIYFILKNKILHSINMFDLLGYEYDEEEIVSENFYNSIQEIKKESEFYNFLLKIARGTITKRELKMVKEVAYDVEYHEDNPSKSEICFGYPDSPYFYKVLGYSEEDLDYYRMYDQGDFEFTEWSSAREEFLEGYLLGNDHVISEDNKKLINEISNFILPGQKLEIEELSRKLYELFESKISDVIDSWTYVINSSYNKSAYEQLQDEIDDVEKKLKIRLYESGRLVWIQVKDLIIWYNMTYSIGEYPYNVIKKIVKSNKINLGGVSDDPFNFDFRFDDYTLQIFNNNLEKNLEEILEKLKSDVDPKILEKIDEITKKYNIGLFYSLPKNPEIIFKINRFDITTKRVYLEYHTNMEKVKSPISQHVNLIKKLNIELASIPIDNFFTFIHSKDLFVESKKMRKLAL